MSDIINAIILGIIQGLTEFLPVSSSGHIEIAKALLGEQSVGKESLMMTVVVHFATAMSTIAVFRKDIIDIISGLFKNNEEDRSFAIKIILSMIPAAMVGFLLEDWLDSHLTGNLIMVCGALLVTAFLLVLADRAKLTGRPISYRDSIIIGIAQAIAIIPGISRSGATISTSVLLGNDKSKAARFSFLMVVPLIVGKMAKDLMDGDLGAETANTTALIAAGIAAFVTGILACSLMLKIVRNSQLKYFAIYCAIVGVVGLCTLLL
jgi:undecaprenyl-diphosphatase